MTTTDTNNPTKVSVVINTLNEESNLPYCLRSVAPWASDIVVVDMHSTDNTREIAERYGARVFLHEPLGFADPARAFAVSKATHDWILVLDADELVSVELHDELLRIASANEADVVKIPRRNYMFGAPLADTGWAPARDRQARFFKKSALSITHEIHRFLRPNASARVLELADRPEWHLIHFNYVTVQQFVEKLNRYTTIEAEQALASGRTYTPFQVLRWALSEWYQRYVKCKGFRDGWRGFYLACLMACYRLVTTAKIAELRNVGTAGRVALGYTQIADELLAQYGDPQSRESRRTETGAP